MSDCIPWRGHIDRHGYGRVFRHKLAHREAWERVHGSIQPGLVIDHLCRCRSCVNVEHMELVTPAENMRRGVLAKTHCRHGHPFDSRNTYRTPDGRRNCRACNCAAAQRYKERSEA